MPRISTSAPGAVASRCGASGARRADFWVISVYGTPGFQVEARHIAARRGGCLDPTPSRTVSMPEAPCLAKLEMHRCTAPHARDAVLRGGEVAVRSWIEAQADKQMPRAITVVRVGLVVRHRV